MIPKNRTRELLAHALLVARDAGLQSMTRQAIADHAGVSEGLVTARLGTMAAIRRDVMRAAVRESCVEVVAQGLALRDPHALKAPADLKARAAEYLCK